MKLPSLLTPPTQATPVLLLVSILPSICMTVTSPSPAAIPAHDPVRHAHACSEDQVSSYSPAYPAPIPSPGGMPSTSVPESLRRLSSAPPQLATSTSSPSDGIV